MLSGRKKRSFYNPWNCRTSRRWRILFLQISDRRHDYRQSETDTIPASVTELGNDVFGECINLSAIHVAEANRNYSSEDGILYDKGKTILLFCPKAKIKLEEVRITVPDTVHNIAEYAFDHGSGWQKHVTLVCYEGSPAQKYAEEHEMKFEASRAVTR